MRRSLFDEIRPQPPKPRLKPNVFARAAQWAVQNSLTVLVSALIYCALLVVPLAVSPPQTTRLEFTGQSQADSNWARLQRGFPGIENLATLAIVHPDHDKLQHLREDLVEKLKARNDLFQLVLAPGAGDYYNTYGIYYHKPAELDARVAYALSLKTLFEAIAAAPKGDSLATLVNEVAASIEQGRDPQGLDMLFTESAAAVQSLMTGQDRSVDWLKVAGLALDDNAQAGLVLAWPRPGHVEAANEFIDGAVQAMQADPMVKLVVQKSSLEKKSIENSSQDDPEIAIAGLSFLLANLMLQALLGQIRLALVVLAPVIISALTAASILAFATPAVWLGLWPVIAAAASMGLILGLRFVFAVLEPLQQNRPVLTAAMLVAQKQGAGLLWLSLAGVLPWCAWFLLDDPRFLIGAVALAAAVITAMVATLMLQPALLKLLGGQYDWAAREWVEPVHDGLFGNDVWRAARGILMVALLPMLALGLWFHPALPEATISKDFSNAPVNLLASSPAAGEAIIAKLKSVPQAGAIRWLGAFLPVEVEAKQLVLAQLADVFPKIPPQDPSTLDDLQQQMDTLRESLNNIAAAEHARPELKAAADDFRRSLELFANTGTDKELLSLENRLFGGFNRLASTADDLAKLRPPELSDIDPALKSMFQARTGELRIEVTPANGATSLSLARELDQRGFPVAHPILGGLNSLELFWRNLILWIWPSLVLVLGALVVAIRKPSGIFAGVCVAAAAMAGLAAVFLQAGFSTRPEALLLASGSLTFLVSLIVNGFVKIPITSEPAHAAQYAAEAWAPTLVIGAIAAPLLILELAPWSGAALLLLAATAMSTIVVGLYLAPLVQALRSQNGLDEPV